MTLDGNATMLHCRRRVSLPQLDSVLSRGFSFRRTGKRLPVPWIERDFTILSVRGWACFLPVDPVTVLSRRKEERRDK